LSSSFLAADAGRDPFTEPPFDPLAPEPGLLDADSGLEAAEPGLEPDLATDAGLDVSLAADVGLDDSLAPEGGLDPLPDP